MQSISYRLKFILEVIHLGILKTIMDTNYTGTFGMYNMSDLNSSPNAYKFMLIEC